MATPEKAPTIEYQLARIVAELEDQGVLRPREIAEALVSEHRDLCDALFIESYRSFVTDWVGGLLARRRRAAHVVYDIENGRIARPHPLISGVIASSLFDQTYPVNDRNDRVRFRDLTIDMAMYVRERYGRLEGAVAAWGRWWDEVIDLAAQNGVTRLGELEAAGIVLPPAPVAEKVI